MHELSLTVFLILAFLCYNNYTYACTFHLAEINNSAAAVLVAADSLRMVSTLITQ